MFTGIIQEIGTLRSITQSPEKSTVSISCQTVLQQAEIGDSIAVNGVCLTLVTRDSHGFEADISPETWQRSNLQSLKQNARLNLESALRIGSKLGGHFVQGHVDGTSTVLSIENRGNSYVLRGSLKPELMPFLVEKGSLAVNGISLTVAGLEKDSFSCALIPHTWSRTNLQYLVPGDLINIELDILVKYVFRLMQTLPAHLIKREDSDRSTIDARFLAEHGFI